MWNNIKEEIRALNDQIITWRRDFHQHPELGMEERRTAETIAGILRGFGLEVSTGVGQTGVVGLLEGGAPGKTILLRADMDALPIEEANDLPFRSQNPGVMHACAHDAHMAVLLGVARLFSAHRYDFAGRIKFMFQPGEEGFGGARLMIEDGVLENPAVDAALALHLISHIPTGVIGLKSGPMMASMDSFRIKIKGKGGHAAMPEQGVDAILISAHAITALQSLISKEVSPLAPLVVHVGMIKGGQAFNIMAEEVELKGTVRTLDENLQKSIPERMDRILAGVTGSLRGSHELDYQFGYPILVNHEAMTALVKSVAGQVVGSQKVIEVPAVMGSEDMSFVLQQVPGCFFYVGTHNPDKGADQPHHNSRFKIDEDSLAIGAEVLAAAAWKCLQNP
ncbi:MAG: amidohydrolase [Pseudomonadota bacterium]